MDPKEIISKQDFIAMCTITESFYHVCNTLISHYAFCEISSHSKLVAPTIYRLCPLKITYIVQILRDVKYVILFIMNV